MLPISPPDALAVKVLDEPEQMLELLAVMVTVIGGGSVMIFVEILTHPLASVTVTV
jgi:hypothetical protein